MLDKTKLKTIIMVYNTDKLAVLHKFFIDVGVDLSDYDCVYILEKLNNYEFELINRMFGTVIPDLGKLRDYLNENYNECDLDDKNIR